MNRYLLLLSSLVFFVQCKEKTSAPPMEEESLIELLADMHYAKAASVVDKNVNQDSIRTVFENQVLEIKGVSREDYEHIRVYLDENINYYYDIEQKVHKHLKTMQDDKKS